MRKSLIAKFAGTLLAAATWVYFGNTNVAYPQIFGQRCDCFPDLFLFPDTNCPCPDITVSNVVLKFGKCAGTPPNCSNPIPPVESWKCKATGTVSEDDCTGGVSPFSEPFVVTACCDTAPHPGCEQNSQGHDCSGVAADCDNLINCHIVALDCGPCG